MSASNAQRCPSMNALAELLLGIRGRALGPEADSETSEKSASKIGSRTMRAACWATRSRTVGMPSGRFPPSGLGISTRLDRQRPVGAFAEVALQLGQQPLCPVFLHRGQGHSVDPGRTLVLNAPAPMPPGGRHPSRCGHAGRGSGDPEIAWLLPIACVEVLAPSGGEGSAGPFRSPPHRRDDYRRGGCLRSWRPCLALTSSARAIKAGVLRSRRVVLHADRHYYDPLGLPLPSVPFRLGL